VDSDIQMHEQEIAKLNDSIEATLTQIKALNEELAKHQNSLSVETEQEQLIIASNKDLSSRLALLFALLEPFQKKLNKHQARLDNASYRKKLMSQKVPSTDSTKLIEAQADATISAEKVEIQTVTQASKHLTDQVTELQSQLDSGTLNLKTQRQNISRFISEVIQPCKQKLTDAMLDQESYRSELESAEYSLETAQMCKQHLLKRQAVLAPTPENTSF